MPIGVQLYSVRDDMAKDFKGTLKKVKELGYDGVEFAGLFGNTPEQVKAMCAEIGLNPISAHVPLAEMLADVDKVIADYKAVGCTYIVVPYVTEERRPGGELFLQMVEEIRAIGQKCKEAGLTLLYHNHDFEFKKLESGEYGLDYLYANVSSDLLQTELDQCWVKYSGLEPVEYLKKYPERIKMLHIKDDLVIGESGKIDFEAIFKQFYKNGFKDYVVEQEMPYDKNSTREQNLGRMWDGVAKSATYLNEAKFVK